MNLVHSSLVHSYHTSPDLNNTATQHLENTQHLKLKYKMFVQVFGYPAQFY